MGVKKYLMFDRDGALLQIPAGAPVTSVEQIELVEGVIPALLKLRDAGYRFVIVSNQEGLGTDAYPASAFERVQEKVLSLFTSQGIRFEAIHICPHRGFENCLCRKPHLGLVRNLLASGEMDLRRSCVVSVAELDRHFANNVGLQVFPLPELGWEKTIRAILGRRRTAEVIRSTRETSIRVQVDLDGVGESQVSTGIGYFDHMLEQLAKHGNFDLLAKVTGDLHVDAHHTVEDTALAIGEATREALGEKVGIGRFGFILPMDEAEAQTALDLSGRPSFSFSGKFPCDFVGELPTELVPHFFRSLCDALGAALHIKVEGENTHHMVEACFKSVGRSLRMALDRTGESSIPSTKGVL